MDDLSRLQEVLSNLKECSSNIISMSLQLLNDILVEGKDIHDRFRRETNTTLSSDQIDELFGKAVKEYIKDATTVKNQIDAFAKTIINAGELDEENFLSQVWAGDLYDKTKIDGLEEFYDELCNQESNFTLETIFNKAVELSH